MKIAIRFHNNDFYNCWTGVLKTLFSAYEWQSQLNFTKKQLCKIINEISYSMYLLFQNQFEYSEEKDGEFHNRMKSYLQIEEKDILLNEEVDKFLSETDWDNSETSILDTELYANNIYCI